MRGIFLGNGYDFSLGLLEALVSNPTLALVAVVIPVEDDEERAKVRAYAEQAPRERRAGNAQGRLLKHFAAKMVAVARRHSAQVVWLGSINTAGAAARVARLRADVVVMAGCNQILKRATLEALPPVWNVHPSLLPMHRGPHPEYWTLRSGATRSGVTVHAVTAKIDGGPILAQEAFDVEPWLTGGGLQKRAIALGGRLLGGLVARWEEGDALEGRAQGDGGSYEGRVGLEDVEVPLGCSAKEVVDRARACAPWIRLRLYVERAWWSAMPDPVRPERGRAVERAHDAKVTLLVGAPAVFEGDALDAAPGDVLRGSGGAVALVCDPGVVLFREVAQAR